MGGLLEIGGMGSGDHHMAFALAGRVEASVPAGAPAGYRRHVLRWGERTAAATGGRIGHVPRTIEHAFHGRKPDRKSVPRWAMFLRHAFDPDEDTLRNSHGALEFAGNKPHLERASERYLREERQEDINVAW